MDNFREWLSDNLRYFMLGGAILLIVAVLFFGVRACVGSKKGNSNQKEDQTITTEDQGNVPSSPAKDGETDDGKKDANPMEKGNDEIVTLVESYYKALGEKDIATLRTLEEDLSPADESRVTNVKEYIEGYEVGDVYTKKGLTEGSYVVYTCFDYICKGITTTVPALSQMYVFTDSEDNLKIDADAEQDADISAYMEGLLADEDVSNLISDVKAQYDQAQADDADLAAFLDGLGADASAGSSVAKQDGETLTVTKDCNVRAEADSEGDIIGGYPAGTEVEKKGTEGDWIQIEYEGQTGYIHSSLLE